MHQHMYRQYGISRLALAGGVLGVALLVVAVFLGLRLRLDRQTEDSVALLEATQSAYQTYLATYGQLPGDDGPLALMSMRGEQWMPVMSGDADGNLEAPDFRTFTGVDESGAFWQHLRAAGLIAGEPAAGGVEALPVNVFGGRVGVLAQDMGGGLDGVKLCLSRVPGAAAVAIDTSLDDGVGASGRVRATLGSADLDAVPVDVVLAAPYTTGEYYTLCYRLDPVAPAAN